MPEIPRITAREGVPSLRLPRPTPDQFGLQQFEALGELSRTLGKIDRLSDGAESSQRAQNINSEIEEAIKQKEIQHANDPDAFETESQKAADEVLKAGLAAAPERQRELIQFKLGDNLPKRRGQIRDSARRMRVGNAVVKWNTYRDNLAQELEAEPDPAVRIQKEAEYEAELKSTMLGTGAFSAAQAEEDRRKLLKGRALIRLEADPSRALQDIQAGKFDGLGIEEKFSLRRSANASISAAITAQKNEQKIKQEAADREIQMMVDAGERTDIIQQKVQGYTAAGIFDRNDRKFWDDYLIKDNKNDTPEQTQNAQTFKADFGLQGYPSFAAVSAARAKLKAMRASGEIGVKGAGEIGFMLNRTEQSLRAEGRAMESAARSRQGGKMSTSQALGLIAQNYSGSNPSRPAFPQHRKDVREFTNRVLLDGEDTAVVAKEIYLRSQQTKQRAEQQRQAQKQAAQSDPAKREILERLNALKSTGRIQ
jgi:hypothetical protein